MTKFPKSPARLLAMTAIMGIRNAGYCEEAVAAILDVDEGRFRELSNGKRRFSDEQLAVIEDCTGKSAYDWAVESVAPKTAGSGTNDALSKTDVITSFETASNTISSIDRRAARREILRSMIAKDLSRAERLILILYYFEMMSEKEIGEALDLSESRVGQMHSDILTRLESRLAARRARIPEAAAG